MKTLLPLLRSARTFNRSIKAQGSQARAGVTLSEVLISLMIMGIGIVGLASLFPISVLKSVAATNMTNSAILSYNVRGLRNALSQVNTGAALWQPGLTATSITDNPARPTFILPSNPITRSQFPRLVFGCSTSGVLGNTEPVWASTGPITAADGTIWQPVSIANGYVVDPLGSFRMADVLAPNAGRFYGNDGTNALTVVPRFTAGATTLLQASQIATLPDSWLLQVESVDFTSADNGDGTFTLTFTDQTGLNQIVNPALTPGRLVMFDADMRRVEVRPIITTPAPTSTTLSFRGAVSAGFIPVKIRIETQELRYTWLTTTRVKADGTRNSDAVVFFRRQFGINDERIQGAFFASYVDTSGAASSVIIVKYDENDPPKWKKGGYILDAGRMRWYRISLLEEAFASLAAAKPADYPAASFYPTGLSTGSGTSFARIRIEGRVFENANDGSAIIMPNVVDVFPLNPISIRDVQ
ncbi:hypothetical protein Spb1_11680 [Planctopirus ephydatiae]|uniref:Prepilin-type N-terminal cleavage/methylation domain-containing protein n=1 Tax=Planctopirus ephydatiae TaxID=2528019 RepID=A0A518GL49_9PLAN|nr:hypothetical protein [Planctopirus ephydatiae]QDV29288.1 hypothetical protein Spb1_11680 [Planctopirus ephydatiae]